MSQKIKAPNEKSNGFLWGLVAIVVIAVVVIAVVVIQGRDSTSSKDIEAEDVNFSVSYADGTVTLKSDDVADDAPVVDIYEDYACHHCADLVEADHVDLKQALDDGKLVVNLETVNILDGGDDSGPATRGAAVQMAIAESGNAEAFWSIHDYVFANQSEVSRNWGYSDYADAAESLGVDQDVVDSIRDESVKDEYLDAINSNLESMQDKGVEGTPAIFVDGEEFPVQRDPNNSNKIQNWVPEVLK